MILTLTLYISHFIFLAKFIPLNFLFFPSFPSCSFSIFLTPLSSSFPFSSFTHLSLPFHYLFSVTLFSSLPFSSFTHNLLPFFTSSSHWPSFYQFARKKKVDFNFNKDEKILFLKCETCPSTRTIYFLEGWKLYALRYFLMQRTETWGNECVGVEVSL